MSEELFVEFLIGVKDQEEVSRNKKCSIEDQPNLSSNRIRGTLLSKWMND